MLILGLGNAVDVCGEAKWRRVAAQNTGDQLAVYFGTLEEWGQIPCTALLHFPGAQE